MINSVVLVGRLTHDPELRTVGEGISVTDFSIAVNRFGRNDETDFIGITAWKKQAENVCLYLGKGSLVAVDGRIRVEHYENAEGEKRKSYKVVANTVQFLDSKPKGDTGQSQDEPADDDVPW